MENISTWLLMLILWNVLNETGAQIPPQGFRYASYEETIPRKLTPRYGQQESQHVTYLVHIEGKGHMVHLRQKKGFVPKHFPVFTYIEGELQVDYPFIKDDCFYHGFVEGMPSSLVTLSTCSGGLRGVFQLENGSYEIEPVRTSATFQHAVYRLEEEPGAVRMRCGLMEEEQSHQEARIQNLENVVAKSVSEEEWWTHTRYAKLAFVVDHERYLQFDKNETLAVLQIFEIIHISNLFYEPLSVKLSVVGIEFWSENNFINIVDDIQKTLAAFTVWRRDTLVNRLENDAGHLFAYKDFGTPLGLAYVGKMCNRGWGSAVVQFMSTSLVYVAVTFSHELGHNLGMMHDTTYCRCARKDCIMAKYQASTDKFSNCSYEFYFNLRNAPCLLVPPDPDKMYKIKYCGNKVVENGEQCDCGSKSQCESDPCCQSNCMLHSGATCASGQCCSKCQYRPAETVCREKAGVCDLPEYCDGTSEWCPEDVYVQDGAPCCDGAHCYRGHCTTHSGQCKMIFGKKAAVASENCFRIMNVQGNRFGNCGLRHGVYKKCDSKNILCGRIQCENVGYLPSLEEHNTIIHSQAGKRQCWGMDYHSGMGTADIGAVRDGTPCSSDMMCIDGDCVSVSLLNYDCDVTMCHNRGMCNSHKHCHCDYGWAPPDCLNKGHGGSIDSGPPSPQKEGAITATILGIIFVLLALAVHVFVYYRIDLIQQFRILRAKCHPTESNQEDSPQMITEGNNAESI